MAGITPASIHPALLWPSRAASRNAPSNLAWGATDLIFQPLAISIRCNRSRVGDACTWPIAKVTTIIPMMTCLCNRLRNIKVTPLFNRKHFAIGQSDQGAIVERKWDHVTD